MEHLFPQPPPKKGTVKYESESSPSTSTESGEYTTVAADIERLSRDLIGSHNARTYTGASNNIANTFTAYVDSQATQFTYQEFVALNHKASQIDPEYRLHIENVSVDVNETTGRATVFVLGWIIGRPKNIRREHCVVLQWKRQGGKWMCTELNSIRGAQGIQPPRHD